MIDSINYRVHGINQQKLSTLDQIEAFNNNTTIMLVDEHFSLFKAIMKFKGKSFSVSKLYNREIYSTNDLDEDEFLTINTSKKINDHYLNMNKVRYIDGDIVRDRNLKTRGKYRISSSESSVVFSINPEGGYIDFFVSIPKYLYGHNIAQFIPQIDSSLFNSTNTGNFSDWKTQKKYLYDRFIGFTKSFFEDLYYFFELDVLPNYDYIEITRIDLCYNQYFNTKDEALITLEEQKKIHKKSTKRNSNVHKDYKTSIAFHKSNGSFFKIYHKGSEYISNTGDFKRHMKLNEAILKKKQKYKDSTYFKHYSESYFQHIKNKILEKRSRDLSFSEYLDLFDIKNDEKKKVYNLAKHINKDFPIDVLFLKREADKILRYEISLKGEALSRFYKHKVFRSNCKHHKRFYGMYKDVKKFQARKESYKYKTTIQQKNAHKEFQNFFNRSIGLVLSTSKPIVTHTLTGRYDYKSESDTYVIKKLYDYFNKGSLLESKDIGIFSKNLLSLLVDSFKNDIESFQIKKAKPFDDFRKTVIEFNSRVEANVKDYNALNEHSTRDINGKQIEHKRKKVKYAVELLTETEKQKMGLKKVNSANIIEFYRLMFEKKMTPSQIKDYLQMSTQAFNRRMKALEIFKIQENTINTEIDINVKTDFSQYYYLTSGINYKPQFYLSNNHSYINDKQIKKTYDIFSSQSY